MSHRPQPKYASKDAHRGPWSTCDDCGFINNLSDLQFQYAYNGGSSPINTGFLVCRRCIDPINEQFKLLIIPPDPPPIFNTRAENYTVDETNWLTTGDAVAGHNGGDIIADGGGRTFISNQPNPADNADTALLATTISAPGASVSVLYLDLFNGNPTTIGTSILSLITGSATRTNIASSIERTNTNQTAINPNVITVTSASENTTNVTHVGFYSAAFGGTLLMSGKISASSPTIVEGAAVQFNALSIVITLV